MLLNIICLTSPIFFRNSATHLFSPYSMKPKARLSNVLVAPTKRSPLANSFFPSGVENDALAGSTLQLVDGQSIDQDDGKHGLGVVNLVGMPLLAYGYNRH